MPHGRPERLPLDLGGGENGVDQQAGLLVELVEVDDLNRAHPVQPLQQVAGGVHERLLGDQHDGTAQRGGPAEFDVGAVGAAQGEVGQHRQHGDEHVALAHPAEVTDRDLIGSELCGVLTELLRHMGGEDVAAVVPDGADGPGDGALEVAREALWQDRVLDRAADEDVETSEQPGPVGGGSHVENS